MSEETNPMEEAFPKSAEDDVEFAGKSDPMVTVGRPLSEVQITTVTKRERLEGEELLPVLNIERDPRVRNPPREELQVYDYSVLQAPAQEPEFDEAPGECIMK